MARWDVLPSDVADLIASHVDATARVGSELASDTVVRVLRVLNALGVRPEVRMDVGKRLYAALQRWVPVRLGFVPCHHYGSEGYGSWQRVVLVRDRVRVRLRGASGEASLRGVELSKHDILSATRGVLGDLAVLHILHHTPDLPAVPLSTLPDEEEATDHVHLPEDSFELEVYDSILGWG